MRTLYIILSIIPLFSCSGIPVLFPSSDSPTKEDKKELPVFIRVSDSIKSQEPFLKKNTISKNAKTIECNVKAQTSLDADPFRNKYIKAFDEDNLSIGITFEVNVDTCKTEYMECYLKFNNANSKKPKLETNLPLSTGELISDNDDKFISIFRVSIDKEIISYKISYESGIILVLERNSWTQGGTIRIGECKEKI